MGLSVKKRAVAVATFRYIHVALMETLAAWTPTTPEMEVKWLFGEHIWDVAQHADALGKRTHELRQPLHHSLPPVEGYSELLNLVRQEVETPRRVSGYYDALLPGLGARYRKYLEATDLLMDAPTVRIIEQWRDTEFRMIQQSRDVRTELSMSTNLADSWLVALIEKESKIESLVQQN